MSEDTTNSDTTDQTDDVQVEPQEKQGPNREAARYRHQLRDTEAERDALLQERETRRHSDLLKAVADGSWTDKDVPVLHNPEDLFDIIHMDQSGMFLDDGSLNKDAIEEVLGAAREERPYLFEASPDQLADWQQRASQETKMFHPRLIRGNTYQECLAHAKELAKLIPNPGWTPLAGKRPVEHTDDWTASFGRQLD